MTFLKVFTEAGRVLSAAPAFTDSLRRARQLFYYDDYEEKKKIRWLTVDSRYRNVTRFRE